MMWNDGVIEEYQKSIFSSIWLRYIIVSATGRQAPIQQAGRSPSRLEGSQASSWQTGELGSQQAGLSAIASSALLMIAVVPPHCLGYCYTTIRYGKIWEKEVAQQREGDAGNANGSSAHKIQRRGNSIVQHHRDSDYNSDNK